MMVRAGKVISWPKASPGSKGDGTVGSAAGGGGICDNAGPAQSKTATAIDAARRMHVITVLRHKGAAVPATRGAQWHISTASGARPLVWWIRRSSSYRRKLG